jgi:hypothetical protein
VIYENTGGKTAGVNLIELFQLVIINIWYFNEAYTIKHQMSVAAKASNLLSSFQYFSEINYSNNIVKNNSETVDWNILLITGVQYVTMPSVIVIIENGGCDVSTLYRYP